MTGEFTIRLSPLLGREVWERTATKAIHAVMYYNGEGTLQNRRQAAYWCRKAYEYGLEDAKTLWEEWELWKYE